MLAHFKQREEEIKAMALQATEQLKVKIKKEKEKVKEALLRVEQVTKDNESLQEDNNMFKER